jgi:hypothetical protein
VKVSLSASDIATVAGFMAKPLAMPTSTTIADWLKDPALQEACAAAVRILAALKEDE